MTELTRRGRGIPVGLLIIVIVLFGVSVTSALSIAAVVGAVLLGWVIFRSEPSNVPVSTQPDDIDRLLLAAIFVFAAATALGLSPTGIGPTSTALESLPAVVWLALATYVYINRESASRSKRALVLVLAVGFTALIGVLHISAADGVGFDVLRLHEEAAAAIERGLNPYTDAVTVPDGAPTADPEDVITGYVYPPVTGTFYSIGEWVFSDPRYTSLIAWMSFLTVIGIGAIKRTSVASLLVVLLMTATPGWPLVLRAAWTEPLSLAMAALAFRYWRRPLVSGVFLGMTLGSKQYFVVAAPMLALYRDSGWLRRAIWSLVIVGGTVGLAFALDFQAFWSSAIVFHLSTPIRADSLNLVGLLASAGVNVELPSVLPIVVGLAASVTTARWARNQAQFFLGLAFTLAASFVFSSQAFTNYWFLVAGLCGMVLMTIVSAETEDNASAEVFQRRAAMPPNRSRNDQATDR